MAKLNYILFNFYLNLIVEAAGSIYISAIKILVAFNLNRAVFIVTLDN